ncbi:MAG: geranylgeranylglyceryl/heptaprenylglyceryl phosphate synthase [bacterium]
MKTFETLLSIKERRGAGYFILLDPDKNDEAQLPDFIQNATESGVDAFLIGGSLILTDGFERQIALVKKNTNVPVIIFPGGVQQVSRAADAILFLSLISGRNAEYLIGNHVLAAPMIKRANLEAIPTGYMLIESGRTTSAEFMSGTRPIPRNKPDIALAHALAGELLGLKLLYLEAGSGAEESVPESMIAAIAKHCTLPLIVGGGIKKPEEARSKVAAGASFVVTGTVMEGKNNHSMIRDFAEAVHQR